MLTKLEQFMMKQRSYNALDEHFVGTGIYSYEKYVRLPMDSVNHCSPSIDPDWFREAIKLNWNVILESIKSIAIEDITNLKTEVVIEAGQFLKQVGESI
jgi:hypothetical protein